MSAFSLLKRSGGRIFNLLPILTRKDQQTVKSRKSCSPGTDTAYDLAKKYKLKTADILSDPLVSIPKS